MFNRNPDHIYLNLNEFKYEHCYKIKNFSINLKLITNYYDIKNTILLKKQLSLYNKVLPENILIINGGDSAIDCIVNNYNLKTATISYPTYGYYKESLSEDIKVNGQKNEQVDGQKNDIVFICNPNNPNGTLHNPHDIEKMLNTNINTIHVIDETYMDFLQLSGNYDWTCVNLLSYSNLYIIKSFSKAFGLAGVRLGYIMSNSNNINNIKYNPKNVLELSKIMGIIIMDNLDHYKQQVIKMETDKKKLTDMLDTYKITYINTYANFICIKTKHVHKFLKNSLPYVFRDVSHRKNMDKYVRITICPNVYSLIKYKLLV